MPTQQELEAAANQVITDSGLFHQVITGPVSGDGSIVILSDDPDPLVSVPTVARMLSDIRNEFDAAEVLGETQANLDEQEALVEGFIYERVHRCHWLQQALRKWNADSYNLAPPLGTYFPIVTFGDSLSNQMGIPIYNEMVKRYGEGAVISTFISTGMGTRWSVNKSAEVTTDVIENLTPGGAKYGIPDTKFVEFYENTAGFQNIWQRNGWRKISVILGQRVGGGTAQVTVTQNGVTTANGNIVTSGAAGTLLLLELNEAQGLLPGCMPITRITASGGPVDLIGIIAWRDRGVVPLELARGGASLATMNGTPTASLTFWNNLMGNPPLMLHHMYEEDETGAQLTTHLARVKQYFPQTSHLYLSRAPYTSAAEITAETERSICRTAGIGFMHCMELFEGSITLLQTLGWNGDNLHLGQESYRYMFHALALKMPPLLALYDKPQLARMRAISMLNEAMSVELRCAVMLNKMTLNGSIYENNSASAPGAKVCYLTSGAGTGYAASKLMDVISNSPHALALGNANYQFTLMLRFYNFSMPVAGTGWVQVGATGNMSAPNKALKGFGIDFARPEDVGLVNVGNIAMRLWAYDGVTLVNGPWVLTAQSANTIAQTWFLKYEPGKLSIYGAADWEGLMTEKTCIRTTINGAINAGIHAGVACVGATAAFMGIINAKAYIEPKNMVFRDLETFQF